MSIIDRIIDVKMKNELREFIQLKNNQIVIDENIRQIKINQQLTFEQNHNNINDFEITNQNTLNNLSKIIKSLKVSKNILLIGNPGVGKTSIVDFYSRLVNKPIFKVNLSELTEMSDLLGSEVP